MGEKEEGFQHVLSHPTFWSRRALSLLRLRDTALEAMGPKEAVELLEDLGVETDSPEHAQLERSYLCARASGSRN